MSKRAVRNVTLALTLMVSGLPALHASTSPNTPTSNIVTGGDPEPGSPDVIGIILALLNLA